MGAFIFSWEGEPSHGSLKNRTSPAGRLGRWGDKELCSGGDFWRRRREGDTVTVTAKLLKAGKHEVQLINNRKRKREETKTRAKNKKQETLRDL